jgi:glutathione peroxidase-family protein
MEQILGLVLISVNGASHCGFLLMEINIVNIYARVVLEDYR